MKVLGHVRRLLIVGATLGLMMPQVTFAGERTNSPIRDVALQQGSSLRGEVLSMQGQRSAGKTISLATNGEVVAKAVTGADGKFVVSGVTPGVYSVVVDNTPSTVRLWSGAAAPPSATPELLLVEQEPQVVRGMHGDHFPQWDHPLLVSGLLVTAGLIGGIIGYNIKDDAS